MAAQAMPKEDPWDWPFLLYAATVILRRTEKQFWRMTPRKLMSLLKVHQDLNDPDRPKKKPQTPTGFIDQVIF